MVVLATPTPAFNFRTPPRIIIPKLVISRDKWKVKATDRKHRLHKEKIRTRDLSHSRQQWKDRALAADLKIQELQQQLERSQADLAQAQADPGQLRPGRCSLLSVGRTAPSGRPRLRTWRRDCTSIVGPG